MQKTRRKALRLLHRSADHIEEHGLLFNQCGCLVGTIRFVAGSDAAVGPGIRRGGGRHHGAGDLCRAVGAASQRAC